MLLQNKISVTVITGFLGAGKTTFINFILETHSGKQFALVENEFGDVSIDSTLIKGLDNNRLFELKQGCICCTISNEYELVLQELAEKFPQVEHLIIETTGIADPVNVIRLFFTDELKDFYSFDGAVCMIDFLNFNAHPEKETALKQLAVADEVVITKAEKLQEGTKLEIKSTIRNLNPLADIHFAENGKVESFNLEKMSVKRHYFPIKKTESRHDGIQSRTIHFHQPLNRKQFTHWLSYTLDIYKNEIYRVKGFVCFENEPYEHILQGVGGNSEITEGDKIITECKSTLVFLGKLDKVNLNYYE